MNVDMKITKDFIKKIVRIATQSRSDEIGCDDCFDQLHDFAEMKLQGKSPEEAMPLVQDHLNRCSDCLEEYEALLEALKSLS